MLTISCITRTELEGNLSNKLFTSKIKVKMYNRVCILVVVLLVCWFCLTESANISPEIKINKSENPKKADRMAQASMMPGYVSLSDLEAFNAAVQQDSPVDPMKTSACT